MSKQVEKSKDKCHGCNNVKGCITCVDGSEWAVGVMFIMFSKNN